jgi:hypothetical protein
MTTKQIGEAVNKTERSVQNWAKKTGEKIASIGEKIASVQKTGKPADYTLEETCAIIETGLGKNAADLFRMSAKRQTVVLPQNAEVDLDTAFKAAMIQLVQMTNTMNTRLTNIESRIEQRQALLPAPQISPRQHIIQLVNKYCSNTHREQREVYYQLYSEFGYRTHCNPSLCAKNREMKIIDYIESEGQIEVLEAVAMEILGGAA